MTRGELDRILAIPSGRQLDAMVEEYVMGGIMPVDPAGWPPHYSTNLSDAYAAFKKRGDWWAMSEGFTESGTYRARAAVGFTMGRSFERWADTLALAMCHAALATTYQEQNYDLP